MLHINLALRVANFQQSFFLWEVAVKLQGKPLYLYWHHSVKVNCTVYPPQVFNNLSISYICLRRNKLSLHSKNSRVRFDPETVPFGQTHFWVRLIRNLGQTDTKSESKVSFWLGFRVSLTWFSGRVWPRNGSGQMGPFPGQIWPGSF